MFFDSGRRTASANGNDHDQLRELLEESFGLFDDIEDIITDKYDIEQIDAPVGIDERSLDEAFDDKGLDEAYFSSFPHFVTVDLNDPFQCNCVACEKDRVCGHLWKGTGLNDSINDSTQAFIDKKLNIYVVISFEICDRDLHWVSDYIQGFDIVSIDIISTCRQDIVGVPSGAIVQVLPGIGGTRDHSFAHYITEVLPTRVREDGEHESIIIFIADDIISKEDSLQSFQRLVRTSAAGEQGFTCGSRPNIIKYGQHSFDLSIYHGK